MLGNILLLLIADPIGLSVNAQNSSWPSSSKPLSFINPFQPGGASRAVSAAAAAKVAPDGYAWLLGAVHQPIAPS
ncbi:hypothetical protein [Polynucleobacter ibericus]|uniref:hypothetical protein n=1 Tax=Polynucleobacter ibericus TaxID=1819725 RepID=UPI001BFE8975|nr:hypothetical protein [Polynucleobacter ibericus]QWE09210.1 hypothetical protein AOC20_03065 [Polynucleobacter ibericus]